MRVLRRFAEYCDNQGLVYYLYGGTLLGAVVHGGYIPWDDDVDLIMPRKDYERFRSLVEAEPELAHLQLVDERADGDHPYPFIKLGSRGTVLIDHTAGDRVFPINVDIFPLDTWARPGLRRQAQRVIRESLRRYVELAVSELPRGWRRIFGITAKFFARGFPPNQAAKALTRVARWGSQSKSDRCGLLAWGPGKFLPVDAFGPQVPISFEGELFAGPTDPETILTLGYSPNFRVIPPKAQQVSPHDFEAFA